MVGSESRLRLQRELEAFQLTTWPAFAIRPPDSSAALDEAISDLYGYDWIVFPNAHSVRAFLERLAGQGQDVSNLDSLRVCAIGDATTEALERAQVHVDVTARRFSAASVVAELKNFAGDDAGLDRSNFLIPQAAIGREYLQQKIEDAGARADIVPTYETVSTNDLTRLSALQTMLRTSSIDAVWFGSAGEVDEFTRVFDTNDIGSLVKDTPILTFGGDTSSAVIAFGGAEPIQVSEPVAISIGAALAQAQP